MSDTMISSEDRDAVGRELAGVWWIFLITGIAWLMFAFVVLSFDFETVWAVAVFAGIGFFAMGVTEMGMALANREHRWLHLVMALLGVAAGVFAFSWPGQTFLTLAGILAWYLLFRGTFDITTSLLVRGAEGWWFGLAVGVAEVLVGFWAISYENPGRSVVLLVVWVGVTALSRGITAIFFAFQLRDAR